MKTITIQDLKRHGSKAIGNGSEPIYLIVNSKPKSVILPLHEYESMVELLEDLEDMIAIEQGKNEPSVPWEEVFPEDKQ